jgi:hypothetical protein
MSMRSLLAAALLAVPAAASACGVCIEDKVAAVFDHGVVTRALNAGHHVAFFAVDGLQAPGPDTRRQIEALAASAAGVDRGSTRVSLESQSLSVAYDPRRTPLPRLVQSLEKRLAARKLSLAPLRVIERPGELKTVER